jgi:hypothetical protein
MSITRLVAAKDLGVRNARDDATTASSLRTMPPARVFCMPMNGWDASARAWTISAAVCPCVAQWTLFWTVAKKRCDSSESGL